ncbi:MAG: hypothetical protein JSU85_10740 [Candidatus Zixiibacteriota bacterium]|nr:MAG: hypothetical protein JSU85_10740 [candidate division Zixibacteria bacterium]
MTNELKEYENLKHFKTIKEVFSGLIDSLEDDYWAFDEEEREEILIMYFLLFGKEMNDGFEKGIKNGYSIERQLEKSKKFFGELISKAEKLKNSFDKLISKKI